MAQTYSIEFKEDAELRALKKRIKDLEEENEFLKKASAFFAKNLK